MYGLNTHTDVHCLSVDQDHYWMIFSTSVVIECADTSVPGTEVALKCLKGRIIDYFLLTACPVVFDHT